MQVVWLHYYIFVMALYAVEPSDLETGALSSFGGAITANGERAVVFVTFEEGLSLLSGEL